MTLSATVIERRLRFRNMIIWNVFLVKKKVKFFIYFAKSPIVRHQKFLYYFLYWESIECACGKPLIPRIDQILNVFLYHSKFTLLLSRNISSLGIRAVFVARNPSIIVTIVDRFCFARESNANFEEPTEERKVGYKASTVSYGDGRSPLTKDCSWNGFCTPSHSTLERKVNVRSTFALIYENRFRLLAGFAYV